MTAAWQADKRSGRHLTAAAGSMQLTLLSALQLADLAQLLSAQHRLWPSPAQE